MSLALKSAVNCAEPGECFEFLNVVASAAALFLSLVATVMAVSHKGDVQDCLAGLGNGAGPLQNLMWTLSVNYDVILVLNVASTAVVWLSFFHCETLHSKFGKVMRCITSAKSHAWLLAGIWLTFAMQIFRLGYVFSLHGTLALLAYVCDMGPGVVFLAQELIYTMGNATIAGGNALAAYEGNLPYGQHSATSSYVSPDAIVHKLNLMGYCKQSQNGKDAAGSWILAGCIMTLFTQGLMAMALNGEKERVAAHELHEQYGIKVPQEEGRPAKGADEVPLLNREGSSVSTPGFNRSNFAGSPLVTPSEHLRSQADCGSGASGEASRPGVSSNAQSAAARTAGGSPAPATGNGSQHHPGAVEALSRLTGRAGSASSARQASGNPFGSQHASNAGSLAGSPARDKIDPDYRSGGRPLATSPALGQAGTGTVPGFGGPGPASSPPKASGPSGIGATSSRGMTDWDDTLSHAGSSHRGALGGPSASPFGKGGPGSISSLSPDRAGLEGKAHALSSHVSALAGTIPGVGSKRGSRSPERA